MTTEATIQQTLADYIQTELNQAKPNLVLTPETALIEAGLLDSLSIFKLILFIEEQFALKIPPDEIVVENFETLRALTAFVASKALVSV